MSVQRYNYDTFGCWEGIDSYAPASAHGDASRDTVAGVMCTLFDEGVGGYGRHGAWRVVFRYERTKNLAYVGM